MTNLFVEYPLFPGTSEYPNFSLGLTQEFGIESGDMNPQTPKLIVPVFELTHMLPANVNVVEKHVI